ncbi:unnamed protein product [Darwinula stevensoni]|uniref:Sulfotransferase domain-containing protein n=1 Tax=Darwinula stevensoni TaxID=69355 RepID=A0A7R8X5L0_9CRUS|nr:unnamed protein product [Darwinula stevensoni]CAG0887192.1 unnamed protein product [Darwinula stevensoni]
MPWEWEYLDDSDPLVAKMVSHTTLFDKYVKLKPGDYIMNPQFLRLEKEMKFTVREDDVYISTYPRSGTTWTQEITWCIMHNADLEAAKAKTLMERSFFYEWDYLFPLEEGQPLPEIVLKMDPNSIVFPGNTAPAMEKSESPRLIKTHLPMSLMPEEARTKKVIYVARNPKDVCISYYHHMLHFEEYIGSFDEFVEYFLADLLLWSPHWRHVVEHWKLREMPNMLFLTYEELHQDIRGCISKISDFVGCPLTDDQTEAIVEHTSFDLMKSNKSVNMENIDDMMGLKTQEFIRQGKAGGWRARLTHEQNCHFNEYIQEHLAETGLYFPET